MTNSFLWLKCSIGLAMVALFGLSIALWFNTPDLFEYFNQAFCAH
ncbi:MULTISPECIES: hypothetical protein [unclassified Acinetobacter]|nr:MULTISPECIES: hypothetical protein [unclassified Acinetobacter]